jgi:hypothetical protein
MFPWVAQFIRRAADRLPEERLPCWSGFSFYYSSRRQVPLEKIVRRDTETLDQRILDRLGYFRERGLIIFYIHSPSSTWIFATISNATPGAVVVGFAFRTRLASRVAACNGSTTAAKSANRAIERASGTGTPVFVRFLASVVLSLRDRARSLLSKLNSLLGSE